MTRSLTGYRTLLFAAIVGVAGIFGHYLAPDLVNQFLDAIFVLVAAGIGILRMVTTTPVFTATHPDIEHLLELIPALGVKSTANPDVVQGPVAAAPAQGAATPTAPSDLVSLATSIVGALKTIQSVHDQLVPVMQDAAQKASAALPVGVAAPNPAPQPQENASA